MDKVNEDIPKPTENIVDLSQIKSPKIKSFIQQQLPNLEWIQHKEQAHEGLPSISFNFYFSSHGSIEDVRGRKKAISEADIYVSEMRGWNQFTRDVYDSVSIGEIKPEDALKEIDYPKDDSYYVHLQELKYLYGKRIPVLFVDINQEQLSSLGPIREKPLHDTFAETLPDFKHWLMEDSEYLIAREVLMLAQLNEQIKSVLDLNPDLKSKPNLNISLTLGTAHTWLYHTLYNHGFTTNREFRNNLPIMDLRSEAFRTIRFGKELSDDQVAKVIFNLMLYEFLPEIDELTGEDVKQTPFFRKACNAFTLEEIAEIYDGFVGLTDDDKIHQIISIKLQEKGISIPKTLEELETFS